jgi:hypothetical protein
MQTTFFLLSLSTILTSLPNLASSVAISPYETNQEVTLESSPLSIPILTFGVPSNNLNRLWTPTSARPSKQNDPDSKWSDLAQQKQLGSMEDDSSDDEDDSPKSRLCRHPPQWTVNGGQDLMSKYRGEVTVVALLSAACPFCIRQAFLCVQKQHEN